VLIETRSISKVASSARASLEIASAVTHDLSRSSWRHRTITTTTMTTTTTAIGGRATSGGFQFKVGRTCRDFNVQNAYAKLFAPLVARSASLRLLGAESSGALDGRRWTRSTADVATAKISKSDQWRQVERGASRTARLLQQARTRDIRPACTLKFVPQRTNYFFEVVTRP